MVSSPLSACDSEKASSCGAKTDGKGATTGPSAVRLTRAPHAGRIFIDRLDNGLHQVTDTVLGTKKTVDKPMRIVFVDGIARSQMIACDEDDGEFFDTAEFLGKDLWLTETL